MKGSIAGLAVFVALLGFASENAWSESQSPVALFKIVTVKDEVLIGLNAQDFQALGGAEINAGAVARALAEKKELSVWQYAVHKAANGDLEVVPLRQIGLLAHDSLRVEPYSSPLAVLPHE